MIEGDGLHARYPRHEDLSPTPISAEPVRADAPNADFQVTGHHLAVDGQRGAKPGLTEKGAISEGVMVVNWEAFRNLLTQFLSKIDVVMGAVGTQGRDEPNLLVPDPRLLQFLEDERDDLGCPCGSREIIE
jgi:hypothetical protein